MNSPSDSLKLQARPPGPRGLALIRALNDVRRSPLPTLERLAREYGDVVTVKVPFRHFVLLAHPSLVEHVLLRNGDRYQKSGGSPASRLLFGDALQLANGDQVKAMQIGRAHV